MKKVFIISALIAVTLTLYIDIFSFSTGVGGRTRKQISEPEIGCSCHRVALDPNVNVTIIGPLTVAKSSTNFYRITLTGGPQVKGGFDFNVGHGSVEVAEPDSTINFGLDITHKFPKVFGTRDTISWLVKYIAPDTVLGFDTLFATGNSVNGNGNQDTLDRWNFAENFVVNVVSSIGIEPINSNVPKNFNLFQNYPNPFNPSTKIKFSIPASNSSGSGDLSKLMIYDLLGREIAVLVNENLKPGTYEVNFDALNYTAGVYFYKLTSGSFSETKKMILVK